MQRYVHYRRSPDLLLRAMLLAWATGATVSANALTFQEALVLARSNEPVYLSAKAHFAALRARERMALGGLLPQVTASAASSDNHRAWDTHNPQVSPEVARFRSNNRQVNLTQPIWRHANLIALTQSEVLRAQAELQYLAAEQDLYAKLVGVWLECVSARDAVDVAILNEAAADIRWQLMQRATALGTADTPAREDARAKYAQAQTDRVSATMELNGRIAAMEQLIGALTAFEPPSLSNDFAARDLTDSALDKWLLAAESQSPQINAARRAVDAANDEVRKQLAGHEPTLDLVASHTRSGQEAGNFPGQYGYDLRQNALGLQLTVPIYAGGAQSAKVEEAMALRDKTEQELEAVRRTVRLVAKQAWYGWNAANARQRAAREALDAANLALNSAIAGRASGLNIELDELHARSQVAAAQRDLNRARGDMIAAMFKLKAASGQLTEADLLALAELFADRAPRDER